MYDPPVLQEYMRQANERTLIFAQIESRAGLDAIDDIVQVEGISGAIVGPNDLACDLDCIGDSAPIMDAIATVVQTARRFNKASGIITSDNALLRHAKAHQMGIFCSGSELHMLKISCRNIIKQIEEL